MDTGCKLKISTPTLQQKQSQLTLINYSSALISYSDNFRDCKFPWASLEPCNCILHLPSFCWWLLTNVSVGSGFSESFPMIIPISGVLAALQSARWHVSSGVIASVAVVSSSITSGMRPSASMSPSPWVGISSWMSPSSRMSMGVRKSGHSRIIAVRIVRTSWGIHSGWILMGWKTPSYWSMPRRGCDCDEASYHYLRQKNKENLSERSWKSKAFRAYHFGKHLVGRQIG